MGACRARSDARRARAGRRVPARGLSRRKPFASTSGRFLEGNDAGLLPFSWRGCVFRVAGGDQPPKAGSLFFCRHLAVRSGERLLEIGTGLGLAAAPAARAGAPVAAPDIVPQAVELIPANALVTGVRVDAPPLDCYA